MTDMTAEQALEIVDAELRLDIPAGGSQVVRAWAIIRQALTAPREPVGWQFYQDGRWWYGYDWVKDHRKNTEEAGFRVRDVYAAPAPDELATLQEGWRETIALACAHLGDWLDAHECECEMGHICGRPRVELTRQRLLDMLTTAPPTQGAKPCLITS